MNSATPQKTTYAYDGRDNLTSVTDALSRQLTNAFDALNRPTETVEGANTSLSRATLTSYDPLGNVTEVTTAAGTADKVTTFTFYDTLNRDGSGRRRRHARGHDDDQHLRFPGQSSIAVHERPVIPCCMK